MSVLTIRNISKRFKMRQVVKGVSFDVKSGEIVGLLGPNGAGKTTSFYMVVGLLTPDEGEVQLDDRPIERMAMYRRARIGLSYLPQEASIFRRLTVAENLLVALEAHGYRGAKKSERLNLLLQDFRIDHVKDSYGYSLSGGERRRVEIARALGENPSFYCWMSPLPVLTQLRWVIFKILFEVLKRKILGY